jgi:hypothetical protein
VDDRWEVATAALANLAYTAAVLGCALYLIPGVRTRLRWWGAQQLHSWRYGWWLLSRLPTPRWTRDLAREDLPDEARP